MPYKPARPCAHSGCPALTTNKERLCDAHLKQRNRQLDEQRGTSSERGYDSRWARYSTLYRREHPLCVECQKEGRVTPATDVDHIIPVTGPDDPLFWDPNNHQPLCHMHHSTKTATEDGAFGNRTK